MNDEQLLRYNRQIMLPEVDLAGQEQLLASRVLVVGLGGLGSPVTLYLAAAGVGQLVLADFDRVEMSNLQRQIAHTTQDLGRMKVESARDAVARLNPGVVVETVEQRLDPAALAEWVSRVDLVLDGSDNFATRYAVNAACVAAGKPLVTAAVIRMQGQLANFRFDLRPAPCYQCIFPDTGEEARQTCSDTGVLAPLAGVMGCLQAVEAVKVLLDRDEASRGRLYTFDAMGLEWRGLGVRPDPDCPICAAAGAAVER
ncbi:HesA/MoeB/ThiF family protein [Alkalilimnicola ehrlichii MLHE-1]|uniref:Molybdopterin-synthase adenylyltransferase n=1 Tax=Alkalilimnicola ehrlichii (strain ATCC BAA-1101 / DSM 17681 / MLHE-1) TaxID=187272 RepID=Q0ACI5_ALKEH|nr:molybdopterin-synthase adenylyltransferase MoeB [Alkalilimnicola ehrlichii]ABI55452.1 UBA/THIF-type NAD/FAD binding protein [Alkalilimnicola ehrlichii MLHE-1]